MAKRALSGGEDVARARGRLESAHELAAREGPALARQQAVGVVDAFEPSQRREDRVEVRAVGELALETHARHPIRRGLGGNCDDADVVLGEDPGDVGEQL